MKNSIKALTASIAAVIASAAMISSASAATYICSNGKIYHDETNDCTVYYEDCCGNFRSHSNVSYIGEDEFYGSIFYDPCCGYYACNGGDTYEALGRDFTITEYHGTDRYGRYVYYNKNIGYFVLSGDNYISYGFDDSNVEW